MISPKCFRAKLLAFCILNVEILCETIFHLGYYICLQKNYPWDNDAPGPISYLLDPSQTLVFKVLKLNILS